MRTIRAHGFAVVEVVVAVLLIAAIVGVGYVVYSRNQNAGDNPSALQQVEDADTPAAPTVDDTGDLDAATKVLDDTNIDASASDTAELDAQLSSF